MHQTCQLDERLARFRVRPAAQAANLYPVVRPPTEVPIDAKARLLGEIDSHARSLDPRVKQVMAELGVSRP